MSRLAMYSSLDWCQRLRPYCVLLEVRFKYNRHPVFHSLNPVHVRLTGCSEVLVKGSTEFWSHVRHVSCMGKVRFVAFLGVSKEITPGEDRRSTELM
jgi:hypothetical protein